ncbi:Fc receptor-like protein 5 isoform X2 [Esox lucius]|nr:Fc receptor-like protein 5 isoform X2 [Esox lucius]
MARRAGRTYLVKEEQGLHLLSILVLAGLVSAVAGGSPPPDLIGPDKAYLKSVVVFQCKSPGSPAPIAFELLKDGSPVKTRVVPDNDQEAVFRLKISETSEGSYQCRVTTGGTINHSGMIHLQVIILVSGAHVTSDPQPPVLYEGSRLTLSCDVRAGSHLSYTWFHNRQEVTSLPTSPLNPRLLLGNTLIVENVTAEHAGNYYCIARTMLMDRRFSSSSEVNIKVKAHLSVPQISFTISKEGSSYRCNVTCRSSRGTPPVTFRLLLDNVEVGSEVSGESLVAWFPVPVVPGQDMGVLLCRVENDAQLLTSEPLTLEVVPVGGSVTVDIEYLYRFDSKMSAARLQCHLSFGTFPSFSWSLNGSLLFGCCEGSTSHALADAGRTLLLAEITPENSGYYRCRTKDSYDNASAWVESEPVLVQITEVTMATIEVIAIVFCCFLMLTLAGGVACVTRMLRNPRECVQSSQQPEERRFSDNFCIIRPPLPLSEVTSGTALKRLDSCSADNDVSCVDSDLQNQTLEITI